MTSKLCSVPCAILMVSLDASQFQHLVLHGCSWAPAAGDGKLGPNNRAYAVGGAAGYLNLFCNEWDPSSRQQQQVYLGMHQAAAVMHAGPWTDVPAHAVWHWLNLLLTLN